MKKVKLVEFIHGLSIGGAETLVKNYCLFLDKEKFDIVLICLENYHSMYDKELEKAGVRVIYIYDIIDRMILGPTLFKKICHRILGPWMTRRYTRKEHPDIIHSHVLLNRILEFSAPKYSKLYHTIHSDLNTIWNEKRVRKKDYEAAKRLVKERKMQLIVLHNEMKNEANDLFGIKNAIVINNGIDIRKFQEVGDKFFLRRKYRIKETDFVIGHIGRFVPIKNHEFLLDIFSEICKIDKNAKLWLIGMGPLQYKIQKKAEELEIENKVVFWNIRKDIPELLRMMDLMIMPSFKEGLSVTLIEAQISGVPSLISDTVAEETAISNLANFYSLNKSAFSWAEKAFEIVAHSQDTIYNDLDRWDIKESVKCLENLYLN